MKKAFTSWTDCQQSAQTLLDAAASGAVVAEDLIEQIDIDGKVCFCVSPEKFIKKLMMIIENPVMLTDSDPVRESLPEFDMSQLRMPMMKFHLPTENKTESVEKPIFT